MLASFHRFTVLSRRKLHSAVNVMFADNETMTRAMDLLCSLGFEVSSGAKTDETQTGVRMHHYGLNIDLFENSSIKNVRSLMRSKPNFAKVISLDFYPGITNPYLSDRVHTGIIATLQHAMTDFKKGQNIEVSAYPNCNETAPRYSAGASSGTRDSDDLGVVRPKEVVIPTVDIDGNNISDVILQRFEDVDVVPVEEGRVPGLYRSASPQDHLLLRLFPCRILGIVLRVKSLDVAENYLKVKGIHFERLGNDMSGRELQIVDPVLSLALDLRLVDTSESTTFWREGVTGVVDGSIASMQNSRVFAGEDAGEATVLNTEIDSRTLNGDCWMEVREHAKTKGLAVKGG